MRWYSPFDWILGPETEEEIEELRKQKNNDIKDSKEPGTPVPGLKLLDICNKPMIERFSIECRKTKTKVITLANQKGRRQSGKPIKTRNNYT